MSTDNEQNKNEKLAAELAKAKREIETLKREKRRVGLSFHRIPETGHDISRLWNGDFPYLQKLPDNCLEKPVTDETFHADANTVLIEADNLAALTAMQLTHKGKIDVIYIDPPYNTGNNDFIYNDARKSSIRDVEGVSASDYEASLDGKARMVGKDDPERHSLWLSFMERRLWLAKELLSDKGIVFVSIDDNELSRLTVLMDSIFGEDNFIGNLTWRKNTQPINSGSARFKLQKNIEYIVTYSKNYEMSPLLNLEQGEERTYPNIGANGACRFEGIEDSDIGRKQRDSMKFPILGIKPRDGKRWKIGEELANKLVSEGRIELVDGVPKIAVYPEFDKEKIMPFWSHILESGTAQTGKAELNSVIQDTGFDTVKPLSLMKKIFKAFSHNESVILDFFAGSGTTAQAVAELNKEDGGNRQCILVTHGDEDGKNIAEDITAERMKRVLSGKNWADGKEHDALTGGLYYYKLLFAPKTTNPLTAMETMQARFTGLAAMEQDTHVQLENKSNYTVLINSEKIVIVWKNGDALLDEPETEFYPLLERLKEENQGKELIVYTPSTSSSNSDEYGVSQYGWINYSFPMEYIQAHAALLERMKRNKTMLQPYVDETVVEDKEFVYTDMVVNEENVETSDEDSEGIK